MSEIGPLYPIGDAAARAQVSRDTLIRWDRSGYFPATAKDANGWRYYSEEAVRTLREMLRKRQERYRSRIHPSGADGRFLKKGELEL